MFLCVCCWTLLRPVHWNRRFLFGPINMRFHMHTIGHKMQNHNRYKFPILLCAGSEMIMIAIEKIRSAYASSFSLTAPVIHVYNINSFNRSINSLWHSDKADRNTLKWYATKLCQNSEDFAQENFLEARPINCDPGSGRIVSQHHEYCVYLEALGSI